VTGFGGITCGENFGGVKLFNEHRIGQHGKDRRCLTPQEMTARGWSQDSGGRWRHTSHAPMPKKWASRTEAGAARAEKEGRLVERATGQPAL
jgi:hypothetical protein